MTKLFGRVSWDMSRAACYVRVNVPQYDGIPLSVKATMGGFSRNQFTKGTVVEIEPAGGCKYRIVRVFVDSDEYDDVCRGDYCDDERDTRMVRFFLGKRYFKDDYTRRLMLDILTKSLGMTNREAHGATASYGTWIVCRLDQFARFLIVRDRLGIVNGFQDLRVEYVDSDEKQKKVIVVADRD